jgi:cyclopropane-fatty-acyl-phospholipid synthase
MDAALSISRSQPPELTWLQRSVRHRMLDWMSQLNGGTIHFRDQETPRVFGQSEPNGIQADWNITNSNFYRQVATGGSLGMAESYLRGDWQTNDLTSLLTILYRNSADKSKVTGFTAALTQLFGRFFQFFDGNTLHGSRRHIASHYDLSNEFFKLFLDPTLMYSAAFFEREDLSLHQASVAKLDQICTKLDLQPNEEVLEIGTGWGGLALHAVQKHNIRLTTTTISQAQFETARQRFKETGIDERVRLLDTDYRHLTGQYDKLVSIEMVEAVGERFLDTYFRQCGRLLRPGGRFVIQAIVMPEQRYGSYRRNVDFIQKYIFPGGFLPSVTAMQSSVARTSNLRLHEVQDLSPHYARTLQEWRRRFFDRIDDVRALGFDDRFIRMWEYYLCYCEAAFQEQAVRVVQIVWDKPHQPD